jgi:hypothetical protein
MLNSVRTRMFFLISTLVWATSFNAVAAPIEDAPLPRENEEENTPVDPQKMENLSIAKPKHVATDMPTFVERFNRENYFYSYKGELILHGGFTISFQDAAEPANLINPLIGFDYVFPNEFAPKWEMGVDLSFTSRAYIWFSRRHIVNEKGSFRPFYNYGIMQDFVPDQKLASLSNWDNYLIRVGAGLENTVSPPRSNVVELELAGGTKDLILMFTYGASWGF